MVVQTHDGERVLAHFPAAESVFLLGKFNSCKAAALPMHRRDEDGLWEAVLPEDGPREALAFFVRGRGEAAGRICRHDFAAA